MKPAAIDTRTGLDNDGRFPALATLAKDRRLQGCLPSLALRQGLAVGVVHLQMEQLQVVDVVHLDVVLLLEQPIVLDCVHVHVHMHVQGSDFDAIVVPSALGE